MKFLNFNKPDTDDLERRVNDAESIKEMKETDGWQLVNKLFQEQLEVYKAELLIGCEDWETYLKKQSKAFAISLLLTDIEDFIRQGEEAQEELKKLKS